MTLSRAIELQQQVFLALFNALDPVPVSSSPLGAERYIRMDGFNIVDQPIYRNRDQASHFFFVHVFDRSEQGTHSNLWAIERQVQADAVLRQLRLPDASKIRMTDMQVTSEPRGDGETSTHSFARYNVTIGDM